MGGERKLTGIVRTMVRERDAFETRKQELCAQYSGQFAVFFGKDLVEIAPCLEDALAATAVRFDAGSLPVGVPILIREIAETAGLEVVTELRP